MITAQEAREKVFKIKNTTKEIVIAKQLEVITHCIEAAIKRGNLETCFFSHIKMYDKNLNKLESLGYEISNITNKDSIEYNYFIRW